MELLCVRVSDVSLLSHKSPFKQLALKARLPIAAVRAEATLRRDTKQIVTAKASPFFALALTRVNHPSAFKRARGTDEPYFTGWRNLMPFVLASKAARTALDMRLALLLCCDEIYNNAH